MPRGPGSAVGEGGLMTSPTRIVMVEIMVGYIWLYMVLFGEIWLYMVI